MPGKFIDPKKAHHYKLVHKSVTDPSYEDENTGSTLMHLERGAANKRTKGVSMRDVLNEEYKYNMLTHDDTAEGMDRVFEDEVEEDFDQDFIRQMMMPAEGEEEDDADIGEYPQHENKGRDLDNEFSALLKKEYNTLEMMNEDGDPRWEGPMSVDAYVPAMKELVDGQKQVTFAPSGKEHGTFLDKLEANEDPFGGFRGKNGEMLSVLVSKKDRDILEGWEAEQEEAKKVTLNLLAKKYETEEGAEDERTEYEYVKVKERTDKWDCKTIHTTYSTLENHPTIIAAERGRIKINKKTGAPVLQPQLTASALKQLGEKPVEIEGGAQEANGNPPTSDDRPSKESAEGEKEVDRQSCGESYITVMDTSQGRPKGESHDEKKARKKQVKELKRVMRQNKKELRTMYKAETIRQRYEDPKAKQQAAQLSLA